MAITQAFCNLAKWDFLNGHLSGTDSYKIALYQSPATLDASTTVYTTSQEVTGSGYTAGGLALSGYSCSLATPAGAGVANITWLNNPTIATGSFTARGALIYNTTKGNRAVAVLDFGVDYTCTSGSFTVNMPAAGATAIIRIA